MIGIFGFFQMEKMRLSASEDLCERFVESFSSGQYVTKYHASEAGALGFCSHPKNLFYSLNVDNKDGLIVIFVGEIFNLETLTMKCGLRPSKNAAELIAKLYRKSLLARLSEANGLFCAGILDTRQHIHTLITDRYASFPIHFYKGAKRTSFSTSIYALLSDTTIPRLPCEMGLSQLFTLQRTLGPYTNIVGVKPLPSACIATISNQGISYKKYWELQWLPQKYSDEEIADSLAPALRQAVSRQCNLQNGTAGLLLSGGVDSRIILGAADPGALPSWTVASYEKNPELAIARQVAQLCGSKFNPIINEPAQILAWERAATIENNGIYPASPQYSSFVGFAASACDSLLCGHGLDYTLRGYYLPSKFINIAGTSTRLPVLRSINRPIFGRTVLYNLRQGPPKFVLDRIVRKDKQKQWWENLEVCFDEVLEPWISSHEPLNAWDAFLVNQVSQHYAYTGMMSVKAVSNLRMPAFDNDVFGVYLRMSPEQRVRGTSVYLALQQISPELFNLVNANTGFSAGIGPWKEIIALIGRASLRRFGLFKKAQLPTVQHSNGSWQNLTNLYRYDNNYRQRLRDIRDRLDVLAFGLLDKDQLATCIDKHISGEETHTKLIRQLLTHDNWVEAYDIRN